MRNSSGSEQRQHLMLSRFADSVIREDSINYLGNLNISGCINRIVRNYADISEASVSQYVKKQKNKYQKVLNNTNLRQLPEKERAVLLNSLVQEDLTNSLQHLQSYPKDVPYKIRLWDEIWADLYSEDSWPEEKYYPSQGAYIKALIENYAEKSTFDREEVFFRSTLERLRNMLNLPKTERKILKLQYRTASGNTITCRIKPYKIVADSAKQFHYLIALSDYHSTDTGTYEPASFRISRIVEDSFFEYAKSYGSGNITARESARLDKMLQTAGPQFMLASEETIKVLLTREGINQYNSQYYLRPASSCLKSVSPQKDGSAVYEFVCTALQIKYYFFKFGKEATVLEPQELAESFYKELTAAAQKYESVTFWNQLQRK